LAEAIIDQLKLMLFVFVRAFCPRCIDNINSIANKTAPDFSDFINIVIAAMVPAIQACLALSSLHP
jgi:hypothetical protein